MTRRTPTSHSTEPIERHWRDLRAALLEGAGEGGVHENHLQAMRAAFFCGAHAVIATLAQGPDACDALMLELRRELRDSEATVRRMGLH